MAANFNVIIIGAGLAGLAIAQGLKKNGIPFVIFEKEVTPRDRNWGVTISWAVPYLQECLSPELFDRLKECQPDPGLDCKARGQESVLIRNGATGERLVESTFPGIRRLQIKKTRKIWGENINVQFGKVITGIDTPAGGGVTAHFTDGTSVSGSVLIGTDGGSSWARGALFGEEAQPWELGYHFVNFPFQLQAEQARWLDERIHPIVDVGCHPNKPMYSGIFILDKPELDNPETWVFYVLSTWPKSEGSYRKDEDLLAEYRRHMQGWGDPYKQVADWIPPGTKVRAVEGGLKVFAPRTKWDNRDGRFTIGGDAAHSMTGGNNALRDANQFVSAMIDVNAGGKTLREAVDAYDAEMLQRGASEVEMSSKQTHAFHNYQAFLESPIMKHGIKPTAASVDGSSTGALDSGNTSGS